MWSQKSDAGHQVCPAEQPCPPPGWKSMDEMIGCICSHREHQMSFLSSAEHGSHLKVKAQELLTGFHSLMTSLWSFCLPGDSLGWRHPNPALLRPRNPNVGRLWPCLPGELPVPGDFKTKSLSSSKVCNTKSFFSLAHIVKPVQLLSSAWFLRILWSAFPWQV